MALDFLILYEHTVREYESDLLLKLELERRGYTAEIRQLLDPKHLRLFGKDKPEVLVASCMYDNEAINSHVYNNIGRCNKIVNLHWEQMLSDTQEEGDWFNMNGNASITGNTANGVFVNGGTFTVSGEPTVTGNTGKSGREDDVSNVYLAGGDTITIGGKLDAGASIGVTKGAGGVNSVIATGAKEDYSGKIFRRRQQVQGRVRRDSQAAGAGREGHDRRDAHALPLRQDAYRHRRPQDRAGSHFCHGTETGKRSTDDGQPAVEC